MSALRWIYDDKDGNLFEGIRRIRNSNEANNSTKPPSESDAKGALTVYLKLFEQLSSFVLNLISRNFRVR